MVATATERMTPQRGDALIIVDVQKDFLPGGALAVSGGDEVVPVLNCYVELFHARGLPIYATRDWHPANHCSFQAQGGPWPPHCVADTKGAAFADGLDLPADCAVISKATGKDKDAYSGFEGTDLGERLHSRGTSRVFVGGLATDYCVLNTVRDGIAEGFTVLLLEDAVRAVNLEPEDGARAIGQMHELGARSVRCADLS